MSEEKKELSVITDLATAHGMSREQFEAALKATVFPEKGAAAQFAAFCMVAKQYNLNPLLKEIYAFPAKSGGIVPIVSVDGWCNIINSNPALDGIQFEDRLEDGKLIAITCRIYRKDRAHPVECTEYMSECKRDVDTWKKWPARMLRHKALIQCARYAFSLSGIYDEDEAHRMDMVDVTPKEYSKSPFQGKGSGTQRKTFCDSVVQALTNVTTQEELDIVLKTNQPTIDAMRVSGDWRDEGNLIPIHTALEMAKARLAIVDEEIEKQKEAFGLQDIPEQFR